MLRALLIPMVLVLTAVTAVYFLRSDKPSSATLTVFCAVSLKPPLEAAAAQFQQQTGTAVTLQFGGSGTLLTQLRVARQGDVFIAADEGSLADARRFEIVRESFPIAIQRPVIAVARGNPKRIQQLSDLERADVRLALPIPDAASIGKVAQRLLGDRWQQLTRKAVVMKPSVTEVATDVKLGAADAALIWNSVATQFDGLEAVEVAELSQHQEAASAATLLHSRAPELATAFARFLSDPNQGGKVFRSFGFDIPTAK